MTRSDSRPAASLVERSLAYLWHPCTQMQRAAIAPPLPIVRGRGVWLFDDQGCVRQC